MDPMRSSDLRVLVDYHYWATRQVLVAAAGLTDDKFRKGSGGTTRDLRATLVHALDVEWSWRLRLRGDPREAWSTDLSIDDFPSVKELAEHWEQDEAEMRAWIDGLSDERLAAAGDVEGEIGPPLWYFVMHILTHGTQQRSDAAILLTRAGHSPGDLEFLNYADTLGFRRRGADGSSS